MQSVMNVTETKTVARTSRKVSSVPASSSDNSDVPATFQGASARDTQDVDMQVDQPAQDTAADTWHLTRSDVESAHPGVHWWLGNSADVGQISKLPVYVFWDKLPPLQSHQKPMGYDCFGRPWAWVV